MASEIILKALPFDSREIVNPDTGIIEYDRVAYSADFAKWMATYFSNGVLVPNGAVISDELEVSAASSSLTVIVNTGAILINGRTGWVDRVEQLTVDVGGAANRIDRIVAELNIPNDRQIALKVVKGTTSPPPLIRTDDIYQLSLAQVEVRAGQAVIHSIYDERSDDVCGVSNVLIGVRQPERPKGNANLNILPYEEAETAIYPHAVGDHIMLDGEYFIVTSPIAAGNSIVEGVNITRDYVNDQIIRSKTKHYIEYVTSSGTWTVPEGVTELEVYIVGGGNGGSGGCTSGYGSGGAGGKIGFLSHYKVAPNQVIPVTIGAGGVGGAGLNGKSGGAGGVGGDTSFGYFSTSMPALLQQGGTYNISGLGELLLIQALMPYPQLCPIDNRLYGIPGIHSDPSNTRGVNLSMFGTTISTHNGTTYMQSSAPIAGGGASANENGQDGSGPTLTAGNGGSGWANTGNGGGGGGRNQWNGQAGNGGAGGSGIVVIGYYK